MINSIKVNISFVDFETLHYTIRKEKYVILAPSFFKYHSEYTLVVEDDIKGKVEQYHNFTYSCKRSSIIGYEFDFSENDNAWYFDLIISGAPGFRIWFKTAQEAEEHKNRIEPYIYTEVFEMKHLLS